MTGDNNLQSVPSHLSSPRPLGERGGGRGSRSRWEGGWVGRRGEELGGDEEMQRETGRQERREGKETPPVLFAKPGDTVQRVGCHTGTWWHQTHQ